MVKKANKKEFLKTRKHTKKQKINMSKARRALTEEEVERIYEEVENPLVHTLFWFGLNFGLRPREICNLEISDIDFKEKCITVRNSFGYKTRRIPMTENQTRVLKNWITTRTSNPVEHDYIFHPITYRKLTPANLRNILKSASRKLGIRIHPLKLRYTYALMLGKTESASTCYRKCSVWQTLKRPTYTSRRNMQKPSK